MHVLQKEFGYLLFPSLQEDTVSGCDEKTLNGLGGKFGTIGLYIPSVGNQNDFSNSMQISEVNFTRKLCALHINDNENSAKVFRFS
jgi:hypothetical protein